MYFRFAHIYLLCLLHSTTRAFLLGSFSLSWKESFRSSFDKGLFVINSVSFSLSKITFLLPSFLKDSVAAHTVLRWYYVISALWEHATVYSLLFLLLRGQFSIGFFSFAGEVSFFSFGLLLKSFLCLRCCSCHYDFLGEGFFLFILLEICWDSCLWGLLSFINSGKFSSVFSFNIVSYPLFRYSLSGILI